VHCTAILSVTQYGKINWQVVGSTPHFGAKGPCEGRGIQWEQELIFLAVEEAPKVYPVDYRLTLQEGKSKSTQD
jgi:hypothetical protein